MTQAKLKKCKRRLRELGILGASFSIVKQNKRTAIISVDNRLFILDTDLLEILKNEETQ